MIAKVDIDSLRVGDSNISPVSVARNLDSWFDPMLIMKTHSSVFRGGHAAMSKLRRIKYDSRMLFSSHRVKTHRFEQSF